MELGYDVLVIAHLLGMASLVGGFFAYTTGIVLVGLAESVDSLGKDLDMAKIGVKLVVALVAVACIEIGRARAGKGRDAKTLVRVAGAAGVLNVIVAAAWG